MKKYVSLFIGLILISGMANAQSLSETAMLKVNLLNYDPFPAEAGKYVDVHIKVQNNALSTADDVECELLEEFPFSLDPNENATRDIGALDPLGFAIFDFKVRVSESAVDGENELKIRCDKDKIDDGSYITNTFDINVDSVSPKFVIGSVASVPEKIRNDLKEVKLEVEIQNVGEGDGKLVNTELNLPKGFKATRSYSNSDSLGNIPKDATRTAVFFIDTKENLRSGTYKANLTISYKDDNNNQNAYKEENLILNLRVTESPSLILEEFKAGKNTASEDFDGYIVKGGKVISESKISQGESSQLRIKVTNNGEEKAESVSVRLFKDPTHPFTFDEIYDFVGNLKPGQSGYAVFDFSVEDNAVLKKYFVDIEMRNVDESEVLTKMDTISIDIKKQGGDIVPIIAIVFVIIIAGGIFFYKKKIEK